MRKITFVNSLGQSIELSYQEPFLLNSIEGLGDVDADIQTQKSPFQDGSTYTNSFLRERPIPIILTIKAENEDELANCKRDISSAFNPKLGEGLLRYKNGDVIREIKAASERVPVFPSGTTNRGPTFQKSMIDLIAHNPYWLTEEQVEQLVVWEGGVEFPLELPTTFADQSESKAKILLNEGDAETPIFVAFNGPATSPIQIINQTTGEFIKVNQDLLAGERLEINTAFGQKRVTKVLSDGKKVNAFHFITLDSAFFQLQQGNNLIDYSTGADYERAAVTISWRNRYLSV
jgi:hypothetical protein